MSFTNYISLYKLPIKHSNEICPSKMEVSVGKSSKCWISQRCGAASRRIDLAHVRRPVGGGPHFSSAHGSEAARAEGGNDCGLVPKMWLAHGP